MVMAKSYTVIEATQSPACSDKFGPIQETKAIYVMANAMYSVKSLLLDGACLPWYMVRL